MAAKYRLECLLHHLDSNKRDTSIGPLFCHSSSESAAGTDPKLVIHPTSGLNDELLDIRVSGLRAGQKVTLRAHVTSECGRYRFESSADYIADDYGSISVQNDPSIGGSYTGVEPMGLVWALAPAPEVALKWPRLVKKNIQKPYIYHFELLDAGTGEELQAATIERRFVPDYVERTPVMHGRAKGCLHLPKKKGTSDPMPVLIDIRGVVPFFVEDRPSLLASHGFAVFSVNYYLELQQETKNPFNPRKVFFELQTFHDICDFIKHHPRLDITRVGIVSSCLGSVMAMNAAARFKELPIKCLAATGCLDYLHYDVGIQLPDGSRIEPVKMTLAGEVYESNGQMFWQISDLDYHPSHGAFMTPVEDIDIPMLFFIPGDDHYLSSVKCMNRMVQRVEEAGKRHLLEVVNLEGAGHYIDAPYLPLSKYCNGTPQMKEALYANNGGNPKQHAIALETAWRKTINWFRQQLGVTEIYRQDWLDTPPGAMGYSNKLMH